MKIFFYIHEIPFFSMLNQFHNFCLVIGPYRWRLFSMCWAKADSSLLVLMFLCIALLGFYLFGHVYFMTALPSYFAYLHFVRTNSFLASRSIVFHGGNCFQGHL
jgi:hypothetical protein